MKTTARNWKPAVFNSKRAKAWVDGKMELRHLVGISEPEMAELAVWGRNLAHQNSFTKARAIFMGLWALDPTQAYYPRALGAVAMVEGKLEMALQLFKAALRLNPGDLIAKVNQAEIRLRLGQRTRALADLQQMLDKDPKESHPATRRARLLQMAVG